MPFSFKVKPSGLPPHDLNTPKFDHLICFFFITDDEFSCLAKLAKPYRLCGQTYMPQIPNLLHCIPNCALEVLIFVYSARLMSVFILKPFALFIKG